jgi:hypothetical protein
VITQETILKPISLGRTAIHVAAQCYREWLPKASFEEDVAFYLDNGVVISTPRCFGLARVIEGPRTKGPAWFIRMAVAVGGLDELLYQLPFELPEICLCRGKKGDFRIRSYSLERMRQLTGGKLYGRWRTRE